MYDSASAWNRITPPERFTAETVTCKVQMSPSQHLIITSPISVTLAFRLSHITDVDRVAVASCRLANQGRRCAEHVVA